ncbi:MAG: 50S ribosomal protein L3 [Clostridia bacterium]|nr:50S ribosomal protein L3 [Eubacteriales bacterium]MDD3866124.1 50S ribosomal protein L3 [Eubacteriales bacterium]MDD4461129.1 50S ribosomal protein L3 [Eubacteriales bacterium]NCC84394.1 50S ribosomal protein L3 [Clostridia bacterium]
MGKFMLGRKAGMTQLFNEEGLAIPATVIECGPVVVVQNKKDETDGYKSVKVGFGSVHANRINKPFKGQFDKVGIEPLKVLREFKTDDDFELGQTITVSDMFATGDRVDVSGTSKGKGFAGPIKRHGQRTGPKTHGSKYHRGVGSMGSTTDPGRVFKGKKMPGHMGAARVTVQNLDVVMVDGERHILVIKGAVPGPKGSVVEIRTSVKSK